MLGKRGASAARTSAVGKAVALAVMDRPAQQQSRQQAPINQAQNMLLANTVAGDLLSSLLADLHQEQHQVFLQLLWPATACQFVPDLMETPFHFHRTQCLLVLRQVVS